MNLIITKKHNSLQKKKVVAQKKLLLSNWKGPDGEGTALQKAQYRTYPVISMFTFKKTETFLA